MTEQPNVTVYISEESLASHEVVKQMERWNVRYKVKNITRSAEYRRELQNKGIYCTPATFIKGLSKAILGYQKRKLQFALQIETNRRDFLL